MSDAVAFRMAIPDTYGQGNDVTMRLFFYRTGTFDGDCFIFRVDARRPRAEADIQPYGKTRWVRPHAVDAVDGNGNDNTAPGVFLVINLPINTAAGLGRPNDLASADFLAFELATYMTDGYEYHLLGAEFFESAPGRAALDGAVVFSSQEDVECQFPDCNGNGIDDAADIGEGVSQDCNENVIPDECELVDNDENENGVPDECDGQAGQ